jgi:integrase
VFPSRRISKRRRFPHISPDTLNSALKDLAATSIPFTVHDLRRTSRTLLAKFGVIDEVAELCLGHSLKGVKGVYNVYKYFEERRAALLMLEKHYNKLAQPKAASA